MNFCLCHETSCCQSLRFGRCALTWDRRFGRCGLTWDHVGSVAALWHETMCNTWAMPQLMSDSSIIINDAIIVIICLNISRMRCCKNEKRWKNDCMIVKMREYDAAWWDAWWGRECRGTDCMIWCMIVAGLSTTGSSVKERFLNNYECIVYICLNISQMRYCKNEKDERMITWLWKWGNMRMHRWILW